MANGGEAVIRVRDLVVGFGETTVLDGLSLDVWRGEILGLVGGSGSGKSVLMRTIIGLLPTATRRARRSFGRSNGGGASFSSRARCSRR